MTHRRDSNKRVIMIGYFLLREGITKIKVTGLLSNIIQPEKQCNNQDCELSLFGP